MTPAHTAEIHALCEAVGLDIRATLPNSLGHDGTSLTVRFEDVGRTARQPQTLILALYAAMMARGVSYALSYSDMYKTLTFMLAKEASPERSSE